MPRLSAGKKQLTRRTHKVRLHLLDRLIGYWQSQLFLGNGKIQPQLPPCVKTVLEEESVPLRVKEGAKAYGWGEQMSHFFARIATAIPLSRVISRPRMQTHTLPRAFGSCRRLPWRKKAGKNGNLSQV